MEQSRDPDGVGDGAPIFVQEEVPSVEAVSLLDADRSAELEELFLHQTAPMLGDVDVAALCELQRLEQSEEVLVIAAERGHHGLLGDVVKQENAQIHFEHQPRQTADARPCTQRQPPSDDHIVCKCSKS